MDSWGLYLLAAVALVLVLTPQLTGLARYARESADLRYLEGVRAAVDGLRPGIVLSLGSTAPFAPDSIRFEGRQLSSDCGATTLVLYADWPLANATLTPASSYLLQLRGGVVMVTQVG
jgi:hypothetical protein